MSKNQDPRRGKQRAVPGIVGVALIVLVSATALAAQSMRAVPRISIDELKTLMAQRSVVIIDVRRPDEFAHGRIPGAVNINYTDIMGDAERFADEKRTIVTYCACANETTAARAAVDLAARGVAGAKALKGGWTEWVERGETVEK
jgi:rhodanese-related sulfurtransferase